MWTDENKSLVYMLIISNRNDFLRLIRFDSCFSRQGLLFSEFINKFEFAESKKAAVWMFGSVVGIGNLKKVM